MLHVAIPGRDDLVLAHLVCDVNGTLAVDGQVSESIRERLGRLAEQLQIHLVSADTYGTLNHLPKFCTNTKRWGSDVAPDHTFKEEIPSTRGE